MNKNLKKVISAAAALTISASSFAALAVDFPDVEATASYYQAVQELSALDIISGFEDGTFKPDELVTRAQITKMIVDALGYRNAAESAKGMATKFSDVASGESGHWASGYIATGVSRGFISGHSDTIFAPDDNVTYVQAQKMLVAALGYDSYAQQAGGWPTGYTAYATQKGITNGVKAMSEDQLTRAQVAQMIDNAMDVPLVKVTGTTSSPFGSYPEYSEMDGTDGHMYETLFTDMNVYKVYGRVTKTSRTDNIDVDKVEFQVEKADNFDDEEVTAKDPVAQEMYIGNTNALSMVRTYAQALVQKNDDDEFTLLSLTPAAANKSVALLAEDFDEVKSAAANVLYFYPAGKSTGAVKYALSTDGVTVFVNGVKRDMTEEEVEAYIVENDTALVTLQKETKTGSTNASSDYNVIMITSYGTAVVDYVTDKSSSTSISFKANSNDIESKMTLVKDDDNKSYSFTLNDEPIEPTDLEENDVLTISYNTEDFGDSDFYEVRVSRDIEENAKFKGAKGTDGKEFNFSTGTYKFSVEDQKPRTSGEKSDISVEFTLYLDVNGRVAYKDEVASSKKIGIIKGNVYTERGDEKFVDIITKDGKSTQFSIEDAAVETAITTLYDAVKTFDVAERYAKSVVEYSSTTSGKLTKVNALYDETTAYAEEEEYKASSNKMGPVKVSDAATIIDVSSNDKNDYKVITKDDLQDGVSYTAYGYDKSNSTHRFIVITKGAGGISSASKMVVFLEAGTDSDEERDDIVTITVADPDEDNEQLTLQLDEDAMLVGKNDNTALTTLAQVTDVLSEGDAIIYSTNASGLVDEILPIFDSEFSLPSTFADLTGLTLNDYDWTDLGDNDQERVDVISGMLIKEGSDYSLVTGEVTDDSIEVSDLTSLDLNTSGMRVYTYNYDAGTKNHGRISAISGMSATPIRDSYYKADGNTIDASKIPADDIVYAVARVFDNDEVQEIYLIVAE